MAVQLRALGTVRCYDNDREIVVSGRPLLLLLYLTTIEDRHVGRETLAERFWPQQSSTKARHSLSQALYTLRRAIPQLHLSATESAVMLAKEQIQVDAWQLLAAHRRGDHQKVVELYSGEFLPHLPPQTPVSFTTWRDSNAAKIDLAYTKAVQVLAEHAYNCGDWKGCIDLFAAIDAGKMTEPTLKMIEDARTLLAQSDRSGKGQSLTPHRFVGRHDELERLRKLWANSSSGNPTVCTVRGESGIGKTRLALHFARMVAIEGGYVATVQCYEAESHVPFAAIDTLLQDVTSHTQDSLGEPYASALATIRPTASNLGRFEFGSPTKQLLFEAVSRCLLTELRSRPLLLIIDDAQWCDESTSEWLHYFLRTGALTAARTMVLVCHRNDISSNTGHLGWIESRSDTSIVTLTGLGEAEVAALIQSIAPGTNNSDTQYVKWIRNHCAGHPFYVVAMIRDLPPASKQEAPEGLAPALPQSVQRMVNVRFERLSAEARLVAETLAAAETALAAPSVQVATGLSDSEFARAVEELETAQFLKNAPFELSHDIIKQVVYLHTHPAVRQLRHRRIYQTIKVEARAPILYRQALGAGLLSEAYEHAIAAFRESMTVFAYGEAQHHIKGALRCAVSDDDRKKALYELVGLLQRLGRVSEVRPELKDLIDWSERRGDVDAQLRCTLARIACDLAARIAPVSDLSKELRALIPDAINVGTEIEQGEAVRLALELTHFGSDRGELEVLLEMIDRHARESSHGIRASILCGMSMPLATIDPARGLDTANEAVQLATAARDPIMAIRALSIRGSVNVLLGNISSAFNDFETAELLCTDRSMADALFLVYANRACLHFDLGNWEEAHCDNQRAMHCLSRHHVACFLNEAMGYYSQCEYSRAIEWAERALGENAWFRAGAVDVAARAVMGLSLLGLDRVDEAYQQAQIIDAAVESRQIQMIDWSYTSIFLARIKESSGMRLEACAILRGALDHSLKSDPFGQCRIELALASTLQRANDSDPAFRHAKGALAKAKRLGSTPLIKQAEILLSDLR